MKIFKVTFIEYKNINKTVITNGVREAYTPNGELLVKEEDLEYWMKFGGGFNTLQFIGDVQESV